MKKSGKGSNQSVKKTYTDPFAFSNALGEHKLNTALPSTLYHYTSIGSLQPILENGEFWITHAKYMNDASETLYFWDILDRAVENVVNSEPNNMKLTDLVRFMINEVKNYNQKELYSNLFLLSFSLEPDSLSLWNYYGKNDGYCMGLSSTPLKYNLDLFLSDANDVTSIETASVIYNEERQLEILEEVIQFSYRWCIDRIGDIEIQLMKETIEFKSVVVPLVLLFSKYMAFFKHPGFKDEKEFRFFIRLTENNKRVKYRPYQGVIAPYITFNLKTDEDEIPLESIHVGPLIKHDLAIEGLRSWLKTQKLTIDFEDLKLTQSTIPLRF